MLLFSQHESHEVLFIYLFFSVLIMTIIDYCGLVQILLIVIVYECFIIFIQILVLVVGWRICKFIYLFKYKLFAKNSIILSKALGLVVRCPSGHGTRRFCPDCPRPTTTVLPLIRNKVKNACGPRTSRDSGPDLRPLIWLLSRGQSSTALVEPA